MVPPDQDFRTPLLVLGGARSGKSTWAESVVNRFSPPYVYVATAQALDDEMKLRIRLHRERRKDLWQTIESPHDLSAVLKSLNGLKKPVLVDCITLWLSNLLCSASTEAELAVDGVCKAIEAVDYPLVIVSNEVGGGIVPDNSLARKFRDLSGFTNQRLAQICASVFLVTAGLPLRLK
ncbi:MAG: bifunctional adenosylcobinamide kinase/adenosylcobinamide-phosphate guanylyltransferase [Syntrophobacteraceae bacterium]|jgi:adenosylcobinamide kinase/adenosylcobinamide-phosphate guanylyltransferase